VAGAVVVVVKGGEVLLLKGYGYADRQTRRPVDPQNTLNQMPQLRRLVPAIANLRVIRTWSGVI